MSKQYTLVLIKPSAVKKKLIGPVLTKIEESKLNPIGLSLRLVEQNLAEEHYAQHKGKGFYPQLIQYIMGKLHGPEPTPVVAVVYEGENAIQVIRTLAGDTNPEKARPDSIRGMFGRITTAGLFENVIHASANAIEAEREIKLWFKPDELIDNAIYPTKTVDGHRVWTRIPTLEEVNK